MPNIYYIPGKGYGKFDDNVTLEEAYKRYGISTSTSQGPSPKDSSDVARGFGGAVAGIGSTLRDIGLEDTGRSLQTWGEDVVQRNPAEYNSFRDIKSAGDVAGFAWEKFKESAPQLGLGLAAGLTGGPVAAGAVLGGTTLAQQYGETRQTQREKGIDDRGRAFMTALPAAALDTALGGEGALLRAFGKGVAEETGKSFLKSTGRAALEEAATEPAQQALQRYGGYQSLTSPEAVDEYITSALAGGLVGGMVGGGLYPFTPTQRNTPPSLEGDETSAVNEAGKSLLRLAPPTAYVNEAGETRMGSDSLIEAERQPSSGARYEASERQRANEAMPFGRDIFMDSPVGAQGNLLKVSPDLAPDVEGDVSTQGEQRTPGIAEGQADLFSDVPTAEVKSMVGIRQSEILGTLRGVGTPEQLKASAGLTKLAAKLSNAAAAEDFNTIEDLLASSKLSSKAIERGIAWAANYRDLIEAARQQEAVSPPIQQRLQEEALIREEERRQGEQQAEYQARLAEGRQRMAAYQEQQALDNRNDYFTALLATRDPSAAFKEFHSWLGKNPNYGPQALLPHERDAYNAAMARLAKRQDVRAALPEVSEAPAQEAPASVEGRLTVPAPRQEKFGGTRATPPEARPATEPTPAPTLAVPDVAPAMGNIPAVLQSGQATTEPVATAARERKPREKTRAAKERKKPEGSVRERVGADEKRAAPEAGRGNRLEQIRAVAEKRQKVKAKKPQERVAEIKAREAAAKAEQEERISKSKAKEEPAEAPTLEGQELFAYQNVSAQIDTAREVGDITPQQSMQLKSMIASRVEPGVIQQAIRDAAAQNKPSRKLKASIAQGDKLKASTRAERGKLHDALRKELQRLGLNKVGLGVVADLIGNAYGEKAQGTYRPGWAMIDVVFNDLPKALQTLHHEVIHYLRDANLLNDAEWSKLSKVALADKKLMAHIDNNWKNLNADERVEEAVAEMFRTWMRTQKAQPGIRGILQKIKNFITAIHRGFNKPEFAEAKEIFQAINEGLKNDRNVTSLRGDPSGKVKLRVATRLEKKNIPPQLGSQTSMVADFFNKYFNKFARKAMTHTLIDAAAKAGVKKALKYQQIELEKARVRYSIEQRISKVLEGFDSLPKELRQVGGKINSLLQDSTMAGKWAFKPSWLEEGTYELDPDLQKRYASLPVEGQKFVREVFEANNDLRKQLLETVDAAIDEPYDRLIAEATAAGNGEQVRELKREREGLRAQKTLMFRVDPTKPYASLRRQGKFAVSAKSAEFIAAQENKDNKLIQELQSAPEHNFFNKYETEAEARAEVARLKGLGLYTDVIATTDDSVMSEISGGRETFQAFQRIFKALEDRDGLSEQAKRTLQSVITDLHVMSMTNSSARKSEIKRKNVYGGDLDMVRNFATQSRAMAYHIASLKNNDMLMETINDMNKEVRTAPDPMEASKFRDEILLRHIAGLRATPNTFVETMKRLTAVYKIAFSPSFYIQNFTQVPMVVGPELAARVGVLKATRYVNGAMEEVAKAWKGTKWTESLNIDALPDDVRQIVQELADISLIDVGLDADLGNMQSVRGRAGERWGQTGEALDRTSEAFVSATNIAQDLTRKQESINRVVTAIAGYRMELERSGNKQKATEYATDLVRNTMGTYDAFNAPRYMQGVGGIPFQFRKFQLMQITLLMRHIQNGYTDPNVSDAERAIARQALKYQLGTAALMGGIRGLPGATVLIWLYNTFFGGDDEPANAEEEIRQAVGDKETADFLIYGPPSLLDINLASMIGYGNTFSILPYTKLEMTKEGVAKAAFDLAGAGPATLRDIAISAKDTYDGLQEGREDYYRGLEKMLPKGFTNAVTAYRESTDGIRNYKNDQLVSPEEVEFFDTVKTLLGVQSVENSERFRKQDVEKTLDQFFKDKTAKLKRQYINAMDSNDQAAREEVIQNWREMQDARQMQGKKRQPLSLLLKAKAEQQQEEAMTVGGVQYRSKDERYRQALAEEAADAAEDEQ